jgi:tuftelin-interacting protein 11
MLKTNFNINPASQDLKPLEIILEWYRLELISPLGVCNLVSEELFPKWHRVLWLWLGTPGASLSDICEWYLSWKALFPPILVNHLTRQFRFALDLMNLAMNSPDSLSKGIPPMPTSSSEVPTGNSQESSVPLRLTFFEYIDLACARSGIEFLPLVGKVHSETGKPLYKMSGISGKSTLLYTEHGVLYTLSESGDWNPLAVTEAISLVS